MDKIIDKLSANPEAKTVNNLNELTILAKGLSSKTDMPVFEKRKRLFALFETVLASGKSKLAYHAVEGLQLLLRDPFLNLDSDAGKDDQRTVSQTLSHMSALPSWDRHIQCQAVTVLVQAISSTDVKVHLADVYSCLKVCAATYSAAEDVSVKLAVRAALTQLINSYCINRYSNTAPDSQEEVLVFMDMTTLVKELLLKIDNGQQTQLEELQLGLDALASAVSVQPQHFFKHQPLLTLFTTELIPSLLCLLQTAGERREKTKSFLGLNRANSAKLQKATILSTDNLAKSFYQLVEHLLKLMAPLNVNRSLTVELFRAAMVVPPPDKRHEPLKLLRRFTTTPSYLSSLLNLMALDDSIWPVIVECIEESAKQTTSTDVSVDAIKTLQIMFDAFDSIGDKFDQYTFEQSFFDRVKALNSQETSKTRPITASEEKDDKPPTIDPKMMKYAETFVQTIVDNLDVWLQTDSPIELDLLIQKHAVDVIKAIESNEEQQVQLLNPDAAYLITYSILSLSLSKKHAISTTKRDFLTSISCDGCVVYSNDQFLAAIYLILDQKLDIFDGHELTGKSTLEGIVQDYDGIDKKLLIYQSYKNLDENADLVVLEERVLSTDEMKQLDIWMNRILSNCWHTVETVLSRFPLKNDKKTASSTSEKFSVKGAEMTIEAMRSFSKILQHYRMEREILWLFEKFAEDICNLEDLREFIKNNPEKKQMWTMSRIDVLGIDLILKTALVCGTISPKCWKHVIRTIEYVNELERYQFNLIKNVNTDYTGDGAAATDSLKDLIDNQRQHRSNQPQAELPLKTIGKVLDELMLHIHKLFENSAKQLNLRAYCSFLDLLIAANENNLKYSDNTRVYETCNLIQRMSKMLIDSSNRPLIHLMKSWAVIHQHLIEATGSRFPEDVNRLAVVSISDIIRALLRSELTGFSFHQALFQVFQSMLCSDNCTEETQEHVVSILCSFIQDRPHHISSGWKPLFGAVKAIRISANKERKKASADQSSLSMVHFAVLEVLKKYFEINDPNVFIPTALEFFNCISHYLQSTAESVRKHPEDEVNREEERDAAIGETVFSFIVVAQQLLTEYFESEDVAPTNVMICRLKRREQSSNFVEDNYDLIFKDLPPLTNLLKEEEQLGVFPGDLNESLKRPVESFPWMLMTESQQSVIELILTLIESLSGLVLTCTRQIQTKLISSLSEFISSFQSSPIGADIGSFSLCSLIFPTFQKWVQQEKASGFTLSPESAKSVRSLKQASGILTQVVVEYISESPGSVWSERLLIDCHHLMNSFVSHPSQAISGIGTACLRHLISSTADKYSDRLWKITALSLWRVNGITLAPIRRLCYHYFADSTDFCGDIGEVTVGVKKEDNDKDNFEVSLMSRQIFCIESSEGSVPEKAPLQPPQPVKRRTTTSVDDSAPQTPCSPLPKTPFKQLAYVFKLTKAGSDPLSLHLEDLITSLLNQQMLVQILNSILLGEHSAHLSTGSGIIRSSASTSTDNGFINKAPDKAVGVLFHCLDASTAVSSLFDERPALKMLLQKLCNLDQAANLYKLMIATQSVKLLSVYLLAKKSAGVTVEVETGHLRVFESSLKHLIQQLKKHDQEAATNKLASFARDRLEQRIQINLVENADKTGDATFKSFSVVSASKCLEDYKKQKRVDNLPSKSTRANPFVARLDSTTKQSSVVSEEKLQLSQLNDLDVRILAYSEVIAQTIELYIADDSDTFQRLLPKTCPIIVDYLRISTSLRARNAIANFLTRLASSSSKSAIVESAESGTPVTKND